MVGLTPTAEAFGYFYLITSLNRLVSTALALLVSSISKDIESAQHLQPLIIFCMVLFGGFYVNDESIPIWLRWIGNFSPMKWAFEAVCINEFKNMDFICDIPDESACIRKGDDV